MKLTILLLFISVCSFGQPPKEITIVDDIKLEQLGLLKKFSLSKGEILTIQQHEQDLKQIERVIKSYNLRDSVYKFMFLNNTITPYINQGDTLKSWIIVRDTIRLEFKPKKK